MIKIMLKDLKAMAKQRPLGYYEDVVSQASEVTAEHILLTKEVRAKLIEKYRTTPLIAPEPPGFLTLITNFAGAMLDWMKAGFPVVEETEYKKRMDTCKRCPFWKENLLDVEVLGKCNLCGCTGFKPWLATEFCPKGKW